MNQIFNISKQEGDYVVGTLSISVVHDQEGFILYKVGDTTGNKLFVFKVRQYVGLKIEFMETTSLIHFSFQSSQTIVLKFTRDFFVTFERFVIQAANQLNNKEIYSVYIECEPMHKNPYVLIMYCRNQIKGSLATAKQSWRFAQSLFNKSKRDGEELFLLQLRELLKQLRPLKH
jgi:hypothetical protein